jgi:uncharacterized protein (DUF1501 family)
MGATSLSILKKAFASNGKTLLVIFQRGGCDGLNTVIPYAEDEYYRLRSNISISAPGTSQNSAIDIDGFFGFHPALSPFQEIFQQGDMAIFPTVHYPNGNRSHFSSQDFIESGTSNTRTGNGWLNRYLSLNQQQAHALRGVSFGELSHALRGQSEISTFVDLNQVDNYYFLEDQIKNLEAIFSQQPMTNQPNLELLHKHGNVMLSNIKKFTSSDYKNYSPKNGVNYPDNSYGQQLRQAAYLIKSNQGIEVATINHNGWDDHANQGGSAGPQANRLKDFSSGISAIYQDLGSEYMKDVMILTMTEFGRTAKQNASKGTDHGNASSWFAIGGSINGGIFGDWPGLRPEDLYLGRYLKHTIDYRNILTEIINFHLDSNSTSSNIFPEHSYNPVGFL